MRGVKRVERGGGGRGTSALSHADAATVTGNWTFWRTERVQEPSHRPLGQSPTLADKRALPFLSVLPRPFLAPVRRRARPTPVAAQRRTSGLWTRSFKRGRCGAIAPPPIDWLVGTGLWRRGRCAGSSPGMPSPTIPSDMSISRSTHRTAEVRRPAEITVQGGEWAGCIASVVCGVHSDRPGRPRANIHSTRHSSRAEPF